MTDKLAKTTKCQCKEKKVFLLQRLEKPDQAEKYKTAQQIEECETKVLKISKDIANAEAAGRKATVTAIEDRDKFGRAMADQQRLSKLLNRKPQIKTLGTTKKQMEALVKSRKEKIAKYKKTNEAIRQQLKTLESHLNKCG